MEWLTQLLGGGGAGGGPGAFANLINGAAGAPQNAGPLNAATALTQGAGIGGPAAAGPTGGPAGGLPGLLGQLRGGQNPNASLGVFNQGMRMLQPPQQQAGVNWMRPVPIPGMRTGGFGTA